MPEEQQKLTYVFQKIFASKSGNKGVAQVGSTVAGSTKYLDPDKPDVAMLQNLESFEKGWGDAVQGNYAPIMEEVNAMYYLITRQLAYIFQRGGVAAEWNAETAYQKGSVVGRVGGTRTDVFRSLTDNNLNNPLPPGYGSNAYWGLINSFGSASDGNVPDFSGHVGEVRTTTAEDEHLPANWAPCDGREVTLPDGSTKTLPKLRATNTGDVKTRLIVRIF